MSLISSGEFICFSCDSQNPCEEAACKKTRQIYTAIIWGLSFLIFTTRTPIIYNNYLKNIKSLSPTQNLYRWRRTIIFFCALLTAFVALVRAIIQSTFDEAPLSIYIFTSFLNRLSAFGGLMEVLAILVTWVQVLQACKSLQVPNNNFLYKK